MAPLSTAPTAADEPITSIQQAADSVEAADAADESATPSGEATEGQQEDRFFDPNTLAPELQSQWKKMQGAYTKRMQAIAGLKDQADEYDRLNTDPTTARKFIRERARELGLTVAEPTPTITSSTEGIPAEFIEAIKNNLDPQLQWLAPALAKAQWAGVRTMLKPLADQTQATEQANRKRDYLTAAEALSVKVPGWEEHEDSMNDALTFLNSGTLTHPQFPSKLEVLHWMVTGHAAEKATQLTRQGNAARNRTVTGQAGRSGVSNIADQIRKATRRSEAFDLAAKHAVATLKSEGRLAGEED